MVTIRYYKDPLTGEFTEHKHERVIDFIRSNFFTRDDILDLRFFSMEVLGEELTEEYLDVDEGVVAITHDSKLPRTPDMWIYAAIAIVTAVATVLLHRCLSLIKATSHSSLQPILSGPHRTRQGLVSGSTTSLVMWQNTCRHFGKYPIASV